ncbi:hypothetical protein G6F44_009241 [Rhizopus delemar]|nr:hypothetical protein G6F44_009241 [Rhizopus delemar]
MISSEHFGQLSLPPIPRSKHRYQKYQKTASHKEIYDAITEVECINLQNRLKTAMDKIVLDWTERHDHLVDALDKLESSKHKIEHQYHVQSQRYEKALREVHLYRTRYNNTLQRRFSQTSSNASYYSERGLNNSSVLSEQSSFSSPILFTDERIDPALYHQNLLSDEEHEFDLSSLLSDPVTTPDTISLSPTSPQESTIESVYKEEAKLDVNILKFACGDGFWKAIAEGKSNKAEVDSLVSNYLRRGGNPNVAKISETVNNVKEGYSLVHALIAIKNTASLERVLQAGANPNVFPLTEKVGDMIMPLVLAAKFGYMNGVRLLIEQAGADLLHSKGPLGENALHAAVESNSEEIIDYLLKKSQNALFYKTDSVGATPLHYAAMTGRTRLITLINKHCPAKLDIKDNKGETPLHYAVRNRKLKAVTKLIELGAYPNSYVPKLVPTPLDIAKAGGLVSIAECLKRFGAKTSKDIGRKTSTVTSSSSSTFSGDSSGGSDVSISNRSIRHYLQMKTSRIMKGK